MRHVRPLLLLLPWVGCAGPSGSAEGSGGPAPRPVPGGFALAVGLHLDEDGAVFTPGELRLRPGAWGRGGSAEPGPATPQLEPCLRGWSPAGICAPGVRYASGAGEAWWRAAGGAAQQGWVLRESPPGAGPLVLSMRLVGGAVQAEGEEAFLLSERGAIWRVGGLRAWDAAGRALPVWLEGGGDELSVLVDDQSAVYPVYVDPIYTTAGVTLNGESASSAFGYAVASAGDVNGDGYDDVIVGAPTWSSNIGRAYVYYGSSGGISSSAYTALTGAASLYEFGRAVDGAGDVNNDGFADVVVGAPGASNSAGKAFVYLGGASGVSSTAWVSLSGQSTSSSFGFCVIGGGDFNGDGFADIAVGAPNYNSNTGRVYVYAGSSSTLTLGQTLEGPSTAHQFGRALAMAGRTNNDAYDDLLVGSPGYLSETGAAYVYIGSASGVSTVANVSLFGSSTSNFFGYSVAGAGDVNGDGYADVAVGAYGYLSSRGRVEVFHGGNLGISTSSATSISGAVLGGEFARHVGGAGDIDGDGYDDLIVSTDTLFTNTGSVDVYFGSSAGLSSTSAATLSGSSSLDYFGSWVDGAGDVDADGFADIVVGARGTSLATGSAYVYHGYVDADGDGYASVADCDDGDSAVNPGAVEQCDTGLIDEDCDGLIDDADSGVFGTTVYYPDLDNDGYGDNNYYVLQCAAPSGYIDANGDCDDTDAAIHEGAQEICDPNDADEDCDRSPDDYDTSVDPSGYSSWYPDWDQDGYGAGASTSACDPGRGQVGNGDDCDDNRTDINPGQTERCDSLDEDEDCDGFADNADSVINSATLITFYWDGDADGYGDPALSTLACDEGGGWVSDATDCDDTRADISPADAEICDADNTDENCNSLADDGDPSLDGSTALSWFNDADQDGYGDPYLVFKRCDGESGQVSIDGDCDDSDGTIHPGAAEDCALPIDSNCDGSVGYADADADGHPACTECDDSDAAVHPAAAEQCNLVDDDCDALIDDEDPSLTGAGAWYPDQDGDGFGDAAVEAVTACEAPVDHVADHTDCDDLDASVVECVTPVLAQLSGGCGGCAGAGGAGVGAWALALMAVRRRAPRPA